MNESLVTSSQVTTRTFSFSMVISGIRCMLSYVVFPWLLPLLNIGGLVGAGVGVSIGVVAIYFNIKSINRFRSSGHYLKRLIIPINSAVIVLLTILIGFDIATLVN